MIGFSEAVANMSMEKSPYFHDYVFYMHLIAQCQIKSDEKLPACAGVSFKKDHYVLHLNPNDIKGKDKDGKEVTIKGFNMIMDGELDKYPEAAFNLRGSIQDAIDAGEKMLAEA